MLLPRRQIGIKIRPFNSTLSSSILSIFLKCKDYRILYLRHRGSKTSNSGGSSPTYSEQKSQISNDREWFCLEFKIYSVELIWYLACLREAASAKAGAWGLVLVLIHTSGLRWG